MADTNNHVARDTNGHFAERSFEAVYDALGREVKRIAELRQADQAGVDAALVAAKEATATALTAAKEAVNKAEDNQRRVNEGQNEFRQQLKDQAATFLTRNEYSLAHQALEDKVEVVAKAIIANEGRKEGSSSTWTTIIAIAVAASTIGGIIVGIIFNLVSK